MRLFKPKKNQEINKVKVIELLEDVNERASYYKNQQAKILTNDNNLENHLLPAYI